MTYLFDVIIPALLQHEDSIKFIIVSISLQLILIFAVGQMILSVDRNRIRPLYVLDRQNELRQELPWYLRANGCHSGRVKCRKSWYYSGGSALSILILSALSIWSQVLLTKPDSNSKTLFSQTFSGNFDVIQMEVTYALITSICVLLIGRGILNMLGKVNYNVSLRSMGILIFACSTVLFSIFFQLIFRLPLQ